jgi:hypothetical protein
MSAAPVLRPGRLGTAGGSAARERRLRVAAVTIALAWAAVPMAVAVYHTLRHGGVLTGTDSPLPGADQLFYIDSIRQSGAHLLIADHFDLVIGRAVFLHPLYLLGGIVWRLGVPIQGAFWALSLLAAPALALGALALGRPCLQGRGERAVAVAVGMFYMSPLVPLLAWTGAVAGYQRFLLEVPAGESMPAWQLWGYPHSAVAVGLLALALAGAASIAAGAPPSARRLAWMAGAGALASWLHPWQGAIFIAVTGVLVVRSRSWALCRSLAVPVLAAVAPIAYEEILVHSDAAWHLDSVQNVAGHVPAWMLLVALAPLVIPALAGVRTLAPGPWRTVLVAWPVIAIVVYLFSTEFPYHALEGIAIPLAVLAVAGWRKVPRRGRLASTLGVLAALALALPGAGYEFTNLRDSQRTSAYSYWLAPSDHDALRYLEHLRPQGGVLARYEIGMAVPAFTGRRTWVGEFSWTPHFLPRVNEAEQLFQGRMGPGRAGRFVASVGARYALADCGARVDLPRLLGPLVASTARFGCASVSTLRVTRSTGNRH